MQQQQVKHLVFEGIAGSGKSTLIREAVNFFKKQEKSIFTLSDWCKEHGTIPTFEETGMPEVLVLNEPTHAWIGAAIRSELSHHEDLYPTEALAQAFSLDRLVLYNRLILPAREAGRIIIQDRSFLSSLVYQTVGGMELASLLELPGNALATSHMPTDVILTDIPVSVAVDRATERNEESKGIYEDLPLLQNVDKAYRSSWFTELLNSQQVAKHHIDTSISLKESLSQLETLLTSLFPYVK